MKVNKALKRLTKIEAWISNITERYSPKAPHIREMLHVAKAAVTRAKEAIGLHASFETAKKPPAKHSKPLSKTTKEPAKAKRRISEEGMKRIIAATKKRWALKRAEAAKTKPAVAKKTARNKAAVKKAVPAKSAKKRSTTRKVAVRESATKKTAPTTAQTATEAVGP